MFKKKRRGLDEINSSSMADIAFLLLVFFLVTTTISMDKGINIVLPADGEQKEIPKSNITNILINESGKVLLDDNPTLVRDIKGIAERKMASNDKMIFSVQSHSKTKYNDYLKVLDQLKMAKASRISIANPDM